MYMSPNEGGHTSFPVYGVPLTHFSKFTNNTVRDLIAVTSEETDNQCTGSPHWGYLADATQAISQGAATTAEQHPMIISTMAVNEDATKPDFCTRGTRFGAHSTNESFYAPYYG